MSYGAVSNALSVANPRGVVTSYGYDALYRPITTLMAYGTSVQYAVTTVFDAVSNALSVTNGRNVTTSFGYDALNRRVIQLDAYGNSLQRTSTLVYDLDNNLTASIDPLGFVVTRVYDALNRQVSFTNPDGGIATTQYDADDNVVNSVDQLGHVSTYVFDVLNRGVQMVDARGGIVTLAYDANDNLLSLIDPVANETQWIFDALNRATQELDPLSNVSTAVYDAIDRKTSATDKIGQRLAFNYDLLNRETSEVWLNTSGVTVSNLTYTFDANDNLLSQSWPVAGVAKTSTMSWDALDRLSTMNESFGTLLTSSYDAESNRILIQDSFGGITTRTFDALNRMATISFTGQSTALREDFAYTLRDQVAGQTRYSNLTGTATVGYSTFTYDGVGRLTNLRHANASGSNIANFTNAYDLASRITSEVLNAGLPTTYQYDSTDQLTNDSVVSYSYDLNGNRTMTGYTTGPANELTSDGTWNYAYDKNGNLIQKANISTGEVFAFGYDIRNRMVTATDTTTSSLQMQATYGYDALNQRIQKNVEMGGVATITEFAYDNGQIWVDMNSSNALQTRYLRTDRVLELLSQVTSAGTATWMLADRMGSLRNVVNSTGVVINTITYDGYGNVTSESSPVNGGLYKYAGYRYDGETGLFRSDQTVQRYYSAVIGQWNSADPISLNGGDANLRRYCRNDASNKIDYLGLISFGVFPYISLPEIIDPIIDPRLSRVESGSTVVSFELQKLFSENLRYRLGLLTPQDLLYLQLVSTGQIDITGGGLAAAMESLTVINNYLRALERKNLPNTELCLDIGESPKRAHVSKSTYLLSRQVETLISQLGSNEFDIRQAASKQLEKLLKGAIAKNPQSATAIARLLAEALLAPDEEVSFRIFRILKSPDISPYVYKLLYPYRYKLDVND